MPEAAEVFPRAWIEFPDPDDAEQLIRADLTWLTSRFNCIYGRGCRSIDPEVPYGGCCTHGAHFADGDDEQRVARWVAQLTAAEWQREPGGKVRKRDWAETDPEGDRKTRTVAGACIFLNDPSFSRGAGCALHLLAERVGQSHVATKPDVCWQLPIRREFEWRERNDGSKTLVVTITEYTRDAWGAGGHDFHWYCSSDTSAHTAQEPLYLTSRAELVALVGESAYAQIAHHCRTFEEARAALRLTPAAHALATHPADPPE